MRLRVPDARPLRALVPGEVIVFWAPAGAPAAAVFGFADLIAARAAAIGALSALGVAAGRARAALTGQMAHLEVVGSPASMRTADGQVVGLVRTYSHTEHPLGSADAGVLVAFGGALAAATLMPDVGRAEAFCNHVAEFAARAAGSARIGWELAPAERAGSGGKAPRLTELLRAR